MLKLTHKPLLMTAPIIRGKRRTNDPNLANNNNNNKTKSAANKRVTASGMTGMGGDLPSSGNAWLFRQIRPYLPIQWQYGIRYKAIQILWILLVLSFVASLAKVMFLQSEEEIAGKASRYSYVRDESGTVVDISYKPLIDAGIRARRRQERARADMMEEWDSNNNNNNGD
eukprot:Tbor_TRINITY_DN5521_c7_g2::TRINITY_DN5521_c7_g2_i2::g.13039::m.13039